MLSEKVYDVKKYFDLAGAGMTVSNVIVCGVQAGKTG